MVGDGDAVDEVDSLPEVEGVGGPNFSLGDWELIGASKGDEFWSASEVNEVIPGNVMVYGDVGVRSGPDNDNLVGIGTPFSLCS